MCFKVAGTLKHILRGCDKALEEKPQSRITWRHDSILLAWKKGIEYQIKVTAGRKTKRPADCIQFKSEGFLEGDDEKKAKTSKPWKAVHSDKPSKNILENATDWKVQFDLEENSIASNKWAKRFPSEIAIVSGEGSCPDGVVWSMEKQVVGGSAGTH